MAAGPATKRRVKDPDRDAAAVFEIARRRRMALACRSQALTIPELSKASSQSYANAKTMAEKLRQWGVLNELSSNDSKRYLLAAEWGSALDDARRTAARGVFVAGQQLLLVPADSAIEAARFLGSREHHPHLLWASTVEDSHHGLLLALDDEAPEGEAFALSLQLRSVGVACSLLRLGELSAHADLQELGTKLART